MGLRRKQIYLDHDSDRRIRTLARSTGLSEAEHIRRAVASYVAGLPDTARSDDPLLKMIGLCGRESGPRDAALHHDTYLYGRKP
jgi:hypothetical protein